jgi:hypothetical protein
MDDNEIPLLSWSLHLLGEAEWAASALSSFVLAAVSLGLILVLKRVRSLACRAFVCGGRCVFFLWRGFGSVAGGVRFSSCVRVRLKTWNLFRDAIRAEDSAGWGV